MSWRLDERAHAGPEHLDPDYVAGYEAKSGLDPAEELALLRAHGLGPETTLVDLGAGTGLLALARVHDLLAPGGILVLRDLVYPFEPCEAEAELEAWFARAAATLAEGWTRSELEEHVRAEHSTFSWLLEPLLEHAGFAIQEAEHRGPYATYVCRR